MTHADSPAARDRRLCDLGRQAASCPRFRWMPGMLAWWRLDDGDEYMALRLYGWPDEYTGEPDDPDEPVYPGHLDAAQEHGSYGFPRDAGCWPDLSDQPRSDACWRSFGVRGRHRAHSSACPPTASGGTSSTRTGSASSRETGPRG